MQNPKYRPRTGSPGEITLLLSDRNDPESLRTVMRLAYSELYGIAARHSGREAPGRTLSATALVNEACIRFLEERAVFQNRRHFFGAASKTMRRVLIDSARRRKAQKRGGDWTRLDFQDAERIGFEQTSDLLDLHAALNRLEAVKPTWSEVVEHRVFGGWSNSETAMILGIAESTARRRWTRARNWLRNALANHVQTPAPGSPKPHPAKAAS